MGSGEETVLESTPELNKHRLALLIVCVFSLILTSDYNYLPVYVPTLFSRY